MVKALATYIVDGQLGGVGQNRYKPSQYLAAIFFLPDAQADMPLVPELGPRIEACSAVAAAVEKLTDVNTTMMLLSGLFQFQQPSEVMATQNACSGLP